MNSFKLIVLATALAVAPACKKQEASAPPPATETAGATAGSAMAGSGSAMAGSDTGSAGSAAMAGSDTGSAGSAAMAGSDTGSAAMAGSAAAPAADPDADSIVVLAKHVEVKDTDPVHVRFERFKVVKADFDPKKVEGGKATIEIDTTSLKSGSDKRDGHLQTPDYLDTAKFATVTIDIDKVKKKADKTYAAEATVKFRGVTKKYPVTFDVVDQKDDSIRIKSEVAFSRLDFKVGKDSKDPKIAPVQPELVMQLQLTLKKT
jgi:polyisoprenoid-binding protein YceI